MDWPPQCGGKFSFEGDFLRTHVCHLKPAAYLFYGFFLDIGMPEDFGRAQSALAGL
jgi:NDP-sugar pyrophosphorylase family protein